MATRDVLEELMRNGGEEVSVKKQSLDPAASSLSLDTRSEDIGKSSLSLWKLLMGAVQ